MNNKGFTLIELLIVITIIGLLASIVLASASAARAHARDTRRQADLHALHTAISSYFIDKGTLPRSTGWCTYISNTTSGYGTSFQNDISPKYIVKVPLDPTKAGQVGDYFYKNTNTNIGSFVLCANLEKNTGQTNNYSSCTGGSVYNYCITGL